MLALWVLIANCLYAFVAVVIVAVLQVGALRLVWLSQGGLSKDEQDQFPQSDVLLYGGFLAILMAALAIPLVTAYQARAHTFVDAKYPPDTFRARPVRVNVDAWRNGCTST